MSFKFFKEEAERLEREGGAPLPAAEGRASFDGAPRGKKKISLLESLALLKEPTDPAHPDPIVEAPRGTQPPPAPGGPGRAPPAGDNLGEPASPRAALDAASRSESSMVASEERWREAGGAKLTEEEEGDLSWLNDLVGHLSTMRSPEDKAKAKATRKGKGKGGGKGGGGSRGGGEGGGRKRDPAKGKAPMSPAAGGDGPGKGGVVRVARESDSSSSDDEPEEAEGPGGAGRGGEAWEEEGYIANPNLSNAPAPGPDAPLILRPSAALAGVPPNLRRGKFAPARPGDDGAGGAGGATEDDDDVLRVPASINKYLREYQRDGVTFLYRQYIQGVGGILADDMGLGKTIQTIAFISAVLGKTGRAEDLKPMHGKVVLVVAPTSVLENWAREFDTWGAYKIGVAHGVRFEETLERAADGEVEVVLTTYGMVTKHYEEINEIPWALAVFDEAHQLKNAKTKVYSACKSLPTLLRFGLTGTPMQNDYKELYSLFDWAAPGCLGEYKAFREHYEAPLKEGQRLDCKDFHLAAQKDRQEQFIALLALHMLRRKKELLKDQLPTKEDNIVVCDMSVMQRRAYNRLVRSEDVQHILRLNDPCPCGSRIKFKSCCGHFIQDGIIWNQQHCCTCSNQYHEFTNPKGCKRHRPDGCLSCPTCVLMPLVVWAQKMSNHLELIKVPHDLKNTDVDDYNRKIEVAEMLLGEDADAMGGLHTGGGGYLMQSDPTHCGKMVALGKLLSKWKLEGDKVLVFAYSTRMLDIIEGFVTRQGYSYLRLDGTTNQKDRQRQVDDFNHKPSKFLFLVSTRAGGLGLNLTAANKVVVFDPAWNPALDLQAQDRAFRIGQRRDVQVFRLLSAGTLEENIYTRQIYKQQQANVGVEGSTERRYFTAVQGHRARQGEIFGVQNMFSLFDDSMTKKIVSNQGAVELMYTISKWESDEFTPTAEERQELRDAADELLFQAGDGDGDPQARGLAELAQELLADADDNEAPEGAEAGSRLGGGGGGGGAEGGGGGKRKAVDLSVLDDAGVMYSHRHEAVLGGSNVERRVRESAESKAKGGAKKPRAEACGVPPTPVGRAMGLVESLAHWRHVTPEVMARELLSIPREDVRRLQEEYAASITSVG